MPSSFTWLDHSESHRRRMLDAISRFEIKDTRDELGIGSIRDSFAEQLFPGTSVIQSRAAYLLFVPWIYRNLEARRVSSDQIIRKLKDEEVKLIDALMNSDDQDGVIGKEAREKLKRFPSNIYWQALKKYKIHLPSYSQEQYHRSLTKFHMDIRGRGKLHDDDKELIDPVIANWHLSLPKVPEGFPSQASFRLRRDDAEYLKERILTTTSETMLQFLVAACARPKDAFRSGNILNWGHSTRNCADLALHAKRFAVVFQGAALVYNLMLAEKAEQDFLRDKYRSWLANWADSMNQSAAELAGWNRNDFWSQATQSAIRVPPRTIAFVNDWFRWALPPNDPAKVADRTDVQSRIRERERTLKQKLARLENDAALKNWEGDSGTDLLNYRWKQVNTITNDILIGLNEGSSDA